MTKTTELLWIETLTPHTFSAQSQAKNDQNIQQNINDTVDKAISFLPHNIQADSLYMLFEWSSAASTLEIVITDPAKSHDAPITTRCIFEGIQEEANLENNEGDITQQVTERIKLGIKDYLTTCAGFMQFSLVAAFHDGERSKSELL